MPIKLEWTKEQEQLLVNWAEKASGYAWLHNNCVNLFKRRGYYIIVPASIMGYLAGTTTLMTDNTFSLTWLKILIGLCALFSGILTNIQQMFKFESLTEQHRISALRFLAFFRDVSGELSMHPKHRSNPIDYINMKRVEMDKMLEQSPTIPTEIIKKYKQQTKYLPIHLHHPEIVNVLQTIEPFSINYKEKESYSTEREKKGNNVKVQLKKKYYKLWKLYYLHKKYSEQVKHSGLQFEVANSSITESYHKYNSSSSSENNIISIIQDEILKQPETFTYENVVIQNKNKIEKSLDITLDNHTNI